MSILKVQAGEEPIKTDQTADSTGVTIWEGYPQKGAAADDAAVWAIEKTFTSAAGLVSVTWAGGSIEKKVKWSERSTLTYSQL